MKNKTNEDNQINKENAEELTKKSLETQNESQQQSVQISNIVEDNTRYGDWVIKGHAVDF